MEIIVFGIGAALATAVCWWMWRADAKQKQAMADELAAIKAKITDKV